MCRSDFLHNIDYWENVCCLFQEELAVIECSDTLMETIMESSAK